jgi:hypothetical protein
MSVLVTFGLGLVVGCYAGARTCRARRTWSDHRGMRTATRGLQRTRWAHGRSAAVWVGLAVALALVVAVNA